ncbi:acetyltransferase [Streptomyces toyocaensis]|uniref:Acetyltransferase n=1 Tax=Streptomyces toyocaensis TaxID=55952 RepID=A0A081XLT7_STRTO|nr:GNAT family N-acetyltransferase [Streptomyces toyocaensis]KES04510.1 acetyltransferase [Streptomyces toyocaensis]
MNVALRPVHDSDLPVFPRQSNDPEALHRAAFTPEDPADRDRFAARWARIRSSPEIVVRTVPGDGDVVGHVSVHGGPGEREVTYRVDRAHWGKGVATAALRGLLAEVAERPLYARVAADNAASRRVLERCGFEVSARTTGYASARGAEIDELVLTLHG